MVLNLYLTLEWCQSQFDFVVVLSNKIIIIYNEGFRKDVEYCCKVNPAWFTCF